MPGTGEKASIIGVSGSLLCDPEIKGVSRLLARDGPEKLARDLARAFGITGPLRATVIKQRPGQRALLRVDRLVGDMAEGLAEDGITDVTEEVRPGRSWFIKLLRRKDEGRFLELRTLAAQASALGVAAAGPVGFLPRFRAWVYDAAPGHPVLACCAPSPARRGDTLRDDHAERFRLLGDHLARVHSGIALPLARSGREEERDRVLRAREALARHRPELLPLFDTEAAAWYHSMPTEASEECVIHGDLYPAQVLWLSRPGERPVITLLDWDLACTGEAERDVGNLEAHLVLETLRGHATAEETTRWMGALRRAYETMCPLRPSLLRWFVKGSLLRLAGLYAQPGFGPHLPNAPRLSESLLRQP